FSGLRNCSLDRGTATAWLTRMLSVPPRCKEYDPAARDRPSPGAPVVARPEARLRLVQEGSAALSPAGPALVESYRRLADVFHEVLAEQSLDALLVRIADTLADLIPHDTLTIYEADEAQRVLVPM